MSEPTPRRTMRYWMLFVMLGVLIQSVASASGDAQAPLPEADDSLATPTPAKNTRSRIDIGPISEINPIFRRALDDDDELSEFMHLVEDPNKLLSKQQASIIAEDAHRLTVHGIPTMVVLRESTQNQEVSAVVAENLRVEKRLETAPGADDGILFLVTRNVGSRKPGAPRQSTFLTISHGAHVFPQGGLNESSLQEIHQRFIRPRLRFGLVSDALRVGLRKIIYLETYYPDPSPPLTSLQTTTRATLNVVAPAASVVGIASVAWSWWSHRRRSRGRSTREKRRYTLVIVAASILVMLLAITAVASRSEPGIVAVIAGILAIAAHIRFLASWAKLPRQPLREVRLAVRRHRPSGPVALGPRAAAPRRRSNVPLSRSR